MDDAELDRALQVFLNPGSSGGYDVIGGDERLSRAYRVNAEAVKAAVMEILRTLDDPAPDWRRETFDTAYERVRTIATERFPSFSPLTIAAMSNYWAYQWK